MIAVIFKAIPADGQWDAYLDIAASLKPELITMEGFISIERYQSLSQPGKVLSLSFWKDESSILKWRNLESHRAAQKLGRKSIFDHYRIRIAYVERDYSMTERQQAPTDSKKIHH